jgi:outer membrane protein assembly factor BamB
MRAVIALCLALPVFAADWPQYRGPNRDDVSPETGLLQSWPKEGPPLLWTFEGGGVGYSPPAVIGDRVYITGGRDDDEFLIALDAKGKEVKEAWAVKIGPTFRFKTNSWSAGPSATPTVDGDLIYALGGNGDLVAVDTTGKEKWRISLAKDLNGSVNPIGGGPKDLGWGYTGSPLVDGDKLIVVPGGSKGTLAALDKKTGKVLWRSTELKEQAAYTSPMAADIFGVRQYIILTNATLAGVGTDGKVLWNFRRAQPYGTEVINTPLVKDGFIYTTVAAGNGTCELRKIVRDAGVWTAGQPYSNKNLLNHHGNVVRVGDHIYGCDQRAGWVCLKFHSGEVAWSERKLPSGSVTYADGRLYCYGEGDGTTAIIEASEKGYKEHGRFKIPKQSKLKRPQGKIWTPPVVSGGRLFLRDQEFLFCFDVKTK